MRIIQHHLLNVLLLLCSFWLTSCTTTTLQPSSQSTNQNWAKNQQTLLQMTHWQLKGNLGIKSPEHSGSARLQWQQLSAKDYIISLMGPLGWSLLLYGQPNQVTLETSDGKKFTATTPEQLLLTQTGWNLPLSALYFWMRGLPAPHIMHTDEFDAYHHLISLNQAGWHIQFSRFTTVGEIDMPTLILLNYPHLSIKIIIKQWQF